MAQGSLAVCSVPQAATAVATRCSHSATQHSLANERHDSVVAGSSSKSFWDLPLVEGPARHGHPKTTTFCLVLGFTPSTQPSRAHQSQNVFEQLYSGPLYGPSGRSVWPFPTPFRRFPSLCCSSLPRFAASISRFATSISHFVLPCFPDV